MSSVLVLPYRNPVLTAKMVASLDVLSGGRVTLGVGVGWLKEEFEALDSPDLRQARRGDRRVDRHLQAALDPVARQLHRPILPLCRHPLRTLPVAEAASAHLGRRPFPRRAAPHRAAWRWLAPGRRHRRLAAAAAGNAGAPADAEAHDRGRGPRFLARSPSPTRRRCTTPAFRIATAPAAASPAMRTTSPATSARSPPSACTS